MQWDSLCDGTAAAPFSSECRSHIEEALARPWPPALPEKEYTGDEAWYAGFAEEHASAHSPPVAHAPVAAAPVQPEASVANEESEQSAAFLEGSLTWKDRIGKSGAPPLPSSSTKLRKPSAASLAVSPARLRTPLASFRRSAAAPTAAQPPTQTPPQAPPQAASQAPANAPANSPANAPANAPAQAPADAPANAPAQPPAPEAPAYAAAATAATPATAAAPSSTSARTTPLPAAPPPPSKERRRRTRWALPLCS